MAAQPPVPSEASLIATASRVLGTSLDVSDDAFWDASERRLYSVDCFVETRHFCRAYFSAFDIGWKSLAVAVSDIAAMGAVWDYGLIGLSLPADWTLPEQEAFYQGVRSLVEAVGQGRIIGGDTTGSPVLSVSWTVVGHMAAQHTVGLRSAARPGDLLLTSGPHGLSALGLRALQQGWPGYEASTMQHLQPVPHLAAGQHLAANASRYALMDTSDGLADAAIKIAQASSQVVGGPLRLVLEESALAPHPELLAAEAEQPGWNALQAVLYGGEDFQLLASVSFEEATRLLEKGSPFQVVGCVEAAPVGEAAGAYLATRTAERRPLHLDATYQHFGPASSPVSPADVEGSDAL